MSRQLGVLIALGFLSSSLPATTASSDHVSVDHHDGIQSTFSPKVDRSRLMEQSVVRKSSDSVVEQPAMRGLPSDFNVPPPPARKQKTSLLSDDAVEAQSARSREWISTASSSKKIPLKDSTGATGTSTRQESSRVPPPPPKRLQHNDHKSAQREMKDGQDVSPLEGRPHHHSRKLPAERPHNATLIRQVAPSQQAMKIKGASSSLGDTPDHAQRWRDQSYQRKEELPRKSVAVPPMGKDVRSEKKWTNRVVTAEVHRNSVTPHPMGKDVTSGSISKKKLTNSVVAAEVPRIPVPPPPVVKNASPSSISEKKLTNSVVSARIPRDFVPPPPVRKGSIRPKKLTGSVVTAEEPRNSAPPPPFRKDASSGSINEKKLTNRMVGPEAPRTSVAPPLIRKGVTSDSQSEKKVTKRLGTAEVPRKSDAPPPARKDAISGSISEKKLTNNVVAAQVPRNSIAPPPFGKHVTSGSISRKNLINSVVTAPSPVGKDVALGSMSGKKLTDVIVTAKVERKSITLPLIGKDGTSGSMSEKKLTNSDVAREVSRTAIAPSPDGKDVASSKTSEKKVTNSFVEKNKDLVNEDEIGKEPLFISRSKAGPPHATVFLKEVEKLPMDNKSERGTASIAQRSKKPPPPPRPPLQRHDISMANSIQPGKSTLPSEMNHASDDLSKDMESLVNSSTGVSFLNAGQKLGSSCSNRDDRTPSGGSFDGSATMARKPCALPEPKVPTSITVDAFDKNTTRQTTGEHIQIVRPRVDNSRALLAQRRVDDISKEKKGVEPISTGDMGGEQGEPIGSSKAPASPTIGKDRIQKQEAVRRHSKQLKLTPKHIDPKILKTYGIEGVLGNSKRTQNFLADNANSPKKEIQENNQLLKVSRMNSRKGIHEIALPKQEYFLKTPMSLNNRTEQSTKQEKARHERIAASEFSSTVHKFMKDDHPTITSSHEVGLNFGKACPSDRASRESSRMPANGGASSPHDQSLSGSFSSQNQRISSSDSGYRTGNAQTSESFSVQRRQNAEKSFAPQAEALNAEGSRTSSSNQYRSRDNQSRHQQRGPPLAERRPAITAEPRKPGIRSSSETNVREKRSRMPISRDYEETSWTDRIAKAVPAMPRFSSLKRVLRIGRSYSYQNYPSLDAWEADDDKPDRSGVFWRLFRGSKSTDYIAPPPYKGNSVKSAEGGSPDRLKTLFDRCGDDGHGLLLTAAESKRCRGIGNSQALLDVVCLTFIVLGLRASLLGGYATIGMDEHATAFREGLLTITALFDTWAPFAFAAAFLSAWTNSLLFSNKIQNLVSSVGSTVKDEAEYGMLYLRLISSMRIEPDLPTRLGHTAHLQAIALTECSRLQTFVTFVVGALAFTSVAVVRLSLMSVYQSAVDIMRLVALTSWPIHFRKVCNDISEILVSSTNNLWASVKVQVEEVGHHPLQIGVQLSILLALLIVRVLPMIEIRRNVWSKRSSSDEESLYPESPTKSTAVADLGSSSASRLVLLSTSGAVEDTIERWRLGQKLLKPLEKNSARLAFLRRLAYCGLSFAMLAAPITAFGLLLNVPFSWSGLRQTYFLELCAILLFTNRVVWNTFGFVVQSTPNENGLFTFLQSLRLALKDMSRTQNSPPNLPSSVSPTSGLAVRDLWTAYTAKRAWAVKGANFVCRNGEILVLLGDDGAGKTRFLTALAESMLLPPSQGLTSTLVRGNISLGGVDTTRWDRSHLKKRLGLLLNDVSIVADFAKVWSGSTIEEILEPIDPLRGGSSSGTYEKSCIMLALQMTGLQWSLMPRLPSKLGTVVASSEDDLRPSLLHARSTVLAPTEWSKLLLSKIIAQAVYDNENSAGSSDRVEHSLFGSLLLLDDATSSFSEVEESKLLQQLRATGAASLLTSNKWATGRLADRVVVLRDGMIVEMGTHNELLSRGPQHSLYAAKWHAMTGN